MKEIEEVLARGFEHREEELPAGHKDRFMAKFDKMNTEQEQSTHKPPHRTRRRVMIFSATTAAAVAAVVVMVLMVFRPTPEDLMLSARVAIIEENLVEIDAMHARVLALAREKLELKDYIELQRQFAAIHSEYMELYELAREIPQAQFEKTLRAMMKSNGLIYSITSKHLAGL